MHRFYELWMILIHVGGHCGFEFFPFVPHVGAVLWGALGANQEWSQLLNDVEHHDFHHQSPSHHFSLYYTHWDHLLGTMHPAYLKARRQRVSKKSL